MIERIHIHAKFLERSVVVYRGNSATEAVRIFEFLTSLALCRRVTVLLRVGISEYETIENWERRE